MRTIWGKLGQFGNIGTIWEYKDNLRKFSKLHTISQIVLINLSLGSFFKGGHPSHDYHGKTIADIEKYRKSTLEKLKLPKKI